MDIRIPDLGDFAAVPVIDVHVAPGDTVAAEDPLITLESDKTTMDIPAPAAGTVSDVVIHVGDLASAGDLIVRLSGEPEPPGAEVPVRERVTEDAEPAPAEPPGYGSPSGIYEVIAVTVPYLGDFAAVPVIEVHVAPGDTVAAEDPLITLESDKATMDIPAPVAGTVTAVRVSAGDRVSAGHPGGQTAADQRGAYFRHRRRHRPAHAGAQGHARRQGRRRGDGGQEQLLRRPGHLLGRLHRPGGGLGRDN